jgi:hypothetical protein
MQLLNVALGGTLIQHLPDDVGHTDHRRTLGSFQNADHDVTLTDGIGRGERRGRAAPRHEVPPPPGDRTLGSTSRSPGAASSTSFPKRSRSPARASRSACSGIRKPIRAAASSRRSCGGGRRSRRRLSRQPPGRVPVAPDAEVGLAPVRRSTAIRAAACAVLAAGVAAPLVRRRLRLPPLVVLPAAWSAPGRGLRPLPAYAHARRRGSRAADVGLPRAYEMPNDDPEALRRRVRVEYPVRLDCVLGLGRTPTLRLQRALGSARPLPLFEKVLVWSHWLWFLFPHGTAAYLRARAPDRFPRGATMIYATFDLGMLTYWALPTAPPWYAAQQGLMPTAALPSCGA